MFNVKSVQETLDIIKNEFTLIERFETIPLEEAYGRILAEDIVSDQNIPTFNRSSMDGFAVRARDTFGASDTMPVPLKLTEEIKMGITPTFKLEANQAATIPTGGELPEGSDSVVMIEYTEDYADGFIYIQKSVAPGNNVIFKGDDLHANQKVLKSGVCLRSQDIGILAALGIATLKVRLPLRLAVLSTGDEIVEITQNPIGSQVRDVNAYVIVAEAKRMGLDAYRISIVIDDEELLYMKLNEVLDTADIVVLSGGSSVGMKDNSVAVLNRLGLPGVLVHGIAVKPGKPTLIAKARGKAILGLPGHPASAFTIFRIFGKALIETVTGSVFPDTIVQAKLSVNVPSNHGREEYVPVTLQPIGEVLYAHPLFGKSGMISLLSLADGYIRISRESEGFDKDTWVDVTLYK
ncbi:MAG: gephyrin-like molybdotransferase Glp [Erysipelotrichaceae bacterium]